MREFRPETLFPRVPQSSCIFWDGQYCSFESYRVSYRVVLTGLPGTKSFPGKCPFLPGKSPCRENAVAPSWAPWAPHGPPSWAPWAPRGPPKVGPLGTPWAPLVGPLGTPWAPQGGPFGHPMGPQGGPLGHPVGPPRWALWAPHGPPVSQIALASAGGLPPPRPPATPGGLKPPRTPRLSRPSASEARSLSRARSLAIASSKRRGGLPPPPHPPANYEGAPPPQTPPRFTG